MKDRNIQYEVTAVQSGIAADGQVQLPYSKSLCNRVLTIDALSWMSSGRIDGGWCRRLADGSGVIDVHSDLLCDDTQAMLHWLQSADVQTNGGGEGVETKVVDVGAAGTAMRFSTALLTLLQGEVVITGSARMRERPIAILVDALRSLGADIAYVEQEGCPPLRIRGYALDSDGRPRMQGGNVTLSGSVSSQYISALLMIAPMLPKGLRLQLTGEVISRPYIDMTLCEMERAGARAGWTDERTVVVEPVPYRREKPLSIERDWTAASYWFEVVALAGQSLRELRLQGLCADSSQGDVAVHHIFEQLGVETEFLCDESDTVVLRPSGKVVERLEWDFTPTPDLAQTIAVTCCMLGVPFRFVGVQSLRIKETDRMAALQAELAKLGYVLKTGEGEMSWDGSRCEPQALPVIKTYKDHRMAMAFAPCALTLGCVRIDDAMVVTKSYPHFWEQMRRLGFGVNDISQL